MLEDTLRFNADTPWRAPDTLKSYQARVRGALRALAELDPRFSDLTVLHHEKSTDAPRDADALDALIAQAAYRSDYPDDFSDTAADGSLLPESRDRMGFTVTFGGRTRDPVVPGKRVWFSLSFHGNDVGNAGGSRSSFEFPLSANHEWADPVLARAIVKLLAEHWQASYVSVVRADFQRRLQREFGNRAVTPWMTWFADPAQIACLPSEVRREPLGSGELLVATERLPDPSNEKDLEAARRTRAALAEFGLADEPFYAMYGWPPDAEEEEYESAIGGAPRGRKYVVNCISFDGYDPQRKVLLYAKYFRPLKVHPKAWGLRGWDEPVINEARRQIRAADKAGGVPIEWHIALEEPARRVAELFTDFAAIPPGKIQVFHTPLSAIQSGRG
jgi:hypothetical protein